MRAFDIDLGSAARLMRRGGSSGAFALAGLAVVGWMLAAWVRSGVPGKHVASAVRTGLGTGTDVGRVAVQEAVSAGDKYSAVVEEWYALNRTDRGVRRDPFGEPAAQTGGRGVVEDREPDIHAVWLQDGVRMAVIDGQLVPEGGMHQGYRLERCEAGAVWLTEGGLCRRWAIRFPGVLSDQAGARVP